MPAALQPIASALIYAACQHRDQRRMDARATPYINHPLALFDILVSAGEVDDHVVLCAALLHDTVEDTTATAGDIERLFGARIAAVVSEVTDDKSLPKVERKRLQIAHAAHLSEAARLVKLADKICNLRDMSAAPPCDWDLARRRAYFDWAKQVIDGLRGTHEQLEALFDEAYAARP